MAKQFRIVVPGKSYVKDGIDKTHWAEVGRLVQFDDGFLIEMHLFPLTVFKVFPLEEKVPIIDIETREVAQGGRKK